MYNGENEFVNVCELCVSVCMCVKERERRERESDVQSLRCLVCSHIFSTILVQRSLVSAPTAHGVGVLSPCVINRALREQLVEAPAYQAPP